jgi:hypothetical protein
MLQARSKARYLIHNFAERIDHQIQNSDGKVDRASQHSFNSAAKRYDPPHPLPPAAAPLVRVMAIEVVPSNLETQVSTTYYSNNTVITGDLIPVLALSKIPNGAINFIKLSILLGFADNSTIQLFVLMSNTLPPN